MRTKASRSTGCSAPRLAGGFTLIELLVVVAIIALLAAMLLPALGRAKLKAQGVQCMNNHRQLCLAWRMYTEDNTDKLLFASGKTAAYDPTVSVWCSGNLDLDPANRSNWDPSVDVMKSPMWPYCSKNLGIWRCPSDHSSLSVNGQTMPRVRSMAMNLYLGGFGGTEGTIIDPAYRIYFKYSDLDVPGTSKVFVFVDEREDALNWGNFFADMAGFSPLSPAAYKLADMPGSYHGSSGGFSFADGHAELKRWQDGRTMPPLVIGALVFNGKAELASPNNPDVAWLQDHSSRPK